MSSPVRPAVSVIMPVYNAEATVERALSSALTQSFSDLEVVVVNDCSTDDTCTIIESLDDSRVRLFHNLENGGPSLSRNRALDEARGEWCAVLDSDDWWAPQRLETLLSTFAGSGATMLCDNPAYVRPHATEPFATSLEILGVRCRRALLLDVIEVLRCHLLLVKPLFRRDLLNRQGLRYDHRLRQGEDHHLLLRCLIHGAKMGFSPEPLYFYEAPDRPRPGRSEKPLLEALSAIADEAPQDQSALREALRRFVARREAEFYVRSLLRSKVRGWRTAPGARVPLGHVPGALVRILGRSTRLRVPSLPRITKLRGQEVRSPEPRLGRAS